jgi:uncharacterized damage-inducible protein DinB
MTPEQATFLLNEIYLPQLRNEQKLTRRVIESVPADQCAYKPDPKAKSAFELASHIAGSEMLFLHLAATGQFDRSTAAVPESVKTPEALCAWYDENYAKAVDKLTACSAEDLAKPATFAIFTMPAVAFAGFMLSHSIHHRGQLSTYLRPMGSKIPRIYGGSADEPLPAQSQAQA